MKTFIIIFIGVLFSSPILWADQGAGSFQLASSAFEDNAVIPKKYTCDGTDVNPPLVFNNVPASAKSLALTVSDPDAPTGTWSHWIVYNIPPNMGEIIENTNPGTEGVSDFGKYTYGGPCPPDTKVHHYIFRAYALDTILTIHEGPTMNEAQKAFDGHVITKTELIGTYQK